MKWKCVLNAEMLLIDYVHVDEATLQPNDVAFDAKPDLPATGNYRWNGERFEPFNLGQVWHTPPGPDSWYAIYRALAYLQQRPDVDFPAPVKQWLRYFHNAFRRPGDPTPPA